MLVKNHRRFGDHIVMAGDGDMVPESLVIFNQLT